MGEIVSKEVEWETAHQHVVQLAGRRAAMEHSLAKALLRALRADAWQALGLGSFNEYAERFAGLSPRQTEERLRVAQVLEELPLLDAALADGKLHYSVVRELTRVVVPEKEAEWLAAVDGKSASEVADMVSGRKPGDGPNDPADRSPRMHKLVFEVPGEVYATWREAMAQLRRNTDGHVTEADGLHLMARTYLGGPKDEGRSSYQIQMTMCLTCARTTQDGRGQVVAVDSVAAEVADCDAQRLDVHGATTQDVPPATRRLVVRRQHGKCALPACRNAVFTDVHHLKLRSEGGTHDPDNLICLCATHHHAAHRGTLIIEGTWSAGLTFRHADGSVYGAPTDPHRVEVMRNVYQALVGLGFKEREARLAMSEVGPHVGAEKITLEELLRRALQRLNEWRMGASAG